jgi:CheY-like chemotaxis protein
MAGRILIVDDEDHVLLYLTTLLQDHGYDVISTADPLKAFELAKKERPDLICLDIMMPRKSGASLYKEFRRDDTLKNTPIAIISGVGSIAYGFKRDFRKHLPERDIPEPEAFFEKPIKVPVFVKFLESIFSRKEQE